LGSVIMAATSRPLLSTLKTPVSATYPSEIRSPMLASPIGARDDSLKTPLSPPAAYLDFLARSPTVWSAPPSAALHPPAVAKPDVAGHETQDAAKQDKPQVAVQKPLAPAVEKEKETAALEKAAVHEETPERADKPQMLSTTSASSSESSTTAKSTASSTPSSCDGPKSEAPRPESPASTSSFTSSTTSNPTDAAVKVDPSLSSGTDATASAAAKIDSSKSEIRPRRISMPPGSPFSLPGSARTPRRLGLQIPQSPYSPHVQSPLSATGRCYSPFSATMSPRSAALSPRDRDGQGQGAQSYKHVVTRTVTIARQPAPIMEPVPASKKRKVEPASKKRKVEPSAD
jgi:hypothetical protein